ncbi:vacuolar ATPase assembly integral membrane protein VMA21 homolog [Hylaeus anthracinus]|uniref:vacuolar ATPase assembly integral membrane protein VMA21 homolog n=1 Tax=Hylaeus volcanicus TaxID=313075 RepID=UPI0023B7E579|nr:vacuolar ATPase assembly integral membrane protein VMA21 homolog [Hylaeus volcanicus]XP_054006693.1 vacuolar ATPase assembly integral membrane protein VMA21 homolog [Hylaeus anthracinus]XP_054006694.1 vacuolar ATPase assembly integral membrane protein VMA21 homolog [Hylaeus anthracinus]
MSNIQQLPELQVFKTVLFHCLIIIALPVLSFFTSKIFIFDGLLRLSHVPSNVYSAGVAIIVLHVALGAFIYRAYFDDQSKTQTKRD